MNGGITVIGAGLAGCEAAWQCAGRGVPVTLVEMKPLRRSPAHRSDGFAELVCSNSLRGDRLENAAGLLKEELRRLGSLILRCAGQTRVPAGGALAVDREAFSTAVTGAIRSHPLITVEAREAEEIPKEGQVIVATGPLTGGALAEDIQRFLSGGRGPGPAEDNRETPSALCFYDASAPLVAADSIDMAFAYYGSRYGRAESDPPRPAAAADYLNCPMTKEEYLLFREELAGAKEAPVHGFEDSRVFEGCMPVEVMARRGKDTLRYSAMRPVGLRDPSSGKGAYAVLQLRRDNAAGTVYNMVGFQTHLTFPEQKRVFSMIPALRNAEFLQYGVMHRNSYIDSPRLLNDRYEAVHDPRVRFAGQLTGVEGYIESVASGLTAGFFVPAGRASDAAAYGFPRETATGALAAYISNPANDPFQPSKIHFGLLPPLPDERQARDKQEKCRRLSARALQALEAFLCAFS